MRFATYDAAQLATPSACSWMMSRILRTASDVVAVDEPAQRATSKQATRSTRDCGVLTDEQVVEIPSDISRLCEVRGNSMDIGPGATTPETWQTPLATTVLWLAGPRRISLRNMNLQNHKTFIS